MPARFGHAVQAAGVSTVFLYGGMGCKQYDTVIVGNKNESRCIQLVVLDDAWEFDVLKAFAGQNPFSKLETSPRLSGMMGMSPSTLPDSDSRILMFGGTSVFHARALIYQESPRPTNASFEVRSIGFRSRKASRAELQNMRQLSFNAGLHNDTHVLLFGGFIGNSLSSALFSYEMAAQQPSLGFSLVNTWSPEAPEERSYPGLVIQGDTLYMFGGFRDGEGKSDLWMLDIVSSVWAQVSKEARSHDKFFKLAFNAFSNFKISGTVVIVASGGLQGGYQKGVSFSSKKKTGSDFSVSGDQYFSIGGQDWWGSTRTKSPRECCRFATAKSSAAACQYWLERKSPVEIFNGTFKVKPNEYTDKDEQGNALSEALRALRKGGITHFGMSMGMLDLGSDRGCEPEARAMHTITWGEFANSKASLLVYGGVGQTGKALADFWHVDLQDRDSTYADSDLTETYPLMFLKMTGVADISAANKNTMIGAVADLKKILLAYAVTLDSGLKYYAADTSATSFVSTLAGFDLLRVYNISDKDQSTWAIQGRGFWQYVCDSFNGWFHSGMSGDRTSMWNDAIAAKLKTKVFASAQIESCDRPTSAEAYSRNQFDVAFVQTKYNDTKACDRSRVGEKCMRGICLLDGNYNILINIPDAIKV
jgi:hypothetical protein